MPCLPNLGLIGVYFGIECLIYEDLSAEGLEPRALLRSSRGCSLRSLPFGN